MQVHYKSLSTDVHPSFTTLIDFMTWVDQDQAAQKPILSTWCSVQSIIGQNNEFWTLPNCKSLKTTIANLIKMTESSPKGLKTLWQKEKLLVTSNFSFFHKCFQKTFPADKQKPGLVWERIKS